jgi:hypothetical protein
MSRIPADMATLFVGAGLAAVMAAAWVAFLAQANTSPGTKSRRGSCGRAFR